MRSSAMCRRFLKDQRSRGALNGDFYRSGAGNGNALYVMLLPKMAIRRPPAVGVGYSGPDGSGLRRNGGMNGAQGLQQCCVVCGKVPYRLTAGFRSVTRSQFMGTGVGTGSRPTSQRNDNGFEPSGPSIEAGLRKRKKEGLNLMFGDVRPGCTGSPLAENERFRAVSERVQLQQ